jgi:hypothetical protein
MLNKSLYKIAPYNTMYYRLHKLRFIRYPLQIPNHKLGSVWYYNIK